MELQEMRKLANELVAGYQAHNASVGLKEWDASAYMAGLVGDVGDLSKLISARQGFRIGEQLDQRIGHELADCLWSILVLADQCDVDLESAFRQMIADVLKRIEPQD